MPIDVFGICEKNKPGRGANFIVRPRAQNCLATPLQHRTHKLPKFLFYDKTRPNTNFK